MQEITRVSSYGLIVKARKILLCRVSANFHMDAGYWTLPGGGIEFGEDPVDTMIREVREETGLTVRSKGIAGIDSFCSREKQREEHRAFHGIRIMYYTELLGGDLTYELDGSTDYCAWWSLEETEELPLVDLTVAGLKLAFPT